MLYAPLMKGKVVSWDSRLRGRSVLELNKILSSFFDELDPMSEHSKPACTDNCPVLLSSSFY